MGGKTARQWLFSAIFSAAPTAGRAGDDGREGAEKDPAEKGRTHEHQDKPPKRAFKAPKS